MFKGAIMNISSLEQTSSPGCAACGSKRLQSEPKITRHHFLESGLPNVYIDTQVTTCQMCGEEIVSINQPIQTMQKLGELVILSPGLLTSNEIKFLRKSLLMNKHAFATLTGIDYLSLQSYEEGQVRIPKYLDRLIRLTFAVMMNCSNKTIKSLQERLKVSDKLNTTHIYQL